jgi:small subunit ribosomal protein S16
MSTKIRLSRAGRRNLPFYHVVVADDRCPRDGKFIENIGYYDPILSAEKKNRFNINSERVQYWLSVGAIPTDRIAILLSAAGITAAEKFKPRIKSAPKRKQKKR